MTPAQAALLDPDARVYEAVVAGIEAATDEQLADLWMAAEAAGPGNCGWPTYRVAQAMLPEIRSERLRRLKAAESSR